MPPCPETCPDGSSPPCAPPPCTPGVDGCPDPVWAATEKPKLHSIYPNPSEHHFVLSYSVYGDAVVSFELRTLSNQLVPIIAPEWHPDGVHERWFGENLPAGVYVYRLTIGQHTRTGKLIKR